MELVEEIHTMIIWSNISDKKEAIRKKLVKKFNLISQLEILWDKDKFLDNLKVFYSHSQKHISEEEYESLLFGKINHCGNESFTLFVFEDIKPVYDRRSTSSGKRNVNTNVFDFKKELREKLGGGHQVHASDNTFESNKDLTLILGLNTRDFILNKLKYTQVNKAINQNCAGVGGYRSIEHFFYILNNTISYCVIRNFECLPKEYNIEGHGDIDLLVEDLNYIKYLTLAKSYYPDLDYRVHYGINISNELVPFDFRFVGDDYYDISWQKNILNNLEIFRSLVKVPNTTHYFYSLLYHAYVQKREVSIDYFERLKNMSQELGLNYNETFSSDKIKAILDKFMIKNNFNYTLPTDKTVYSNQLFLRTDSSKIDRFGELISAQLTRFEDQVLSSEVYDSGTEITKFGSDIIIKNEIKFLTILKESNLVPNIYNTSRENNNFFVTMEKINGAQLIDAINNPLFWNKKNIISFVSQCLLFNKVLIDNNIMHRDIRPENIIVNFNIKKEIEVKLIDFGWSVLISERKTASNPIGLGSDYRYSHGNYSDLYSTKNILNMVFKDFHFKNKLIKLFDFKPNEYDDIEKIKLDLIESELFILNNKFKINFKDFSHLMLKNDNGVFKILFKIKRSLFIKFNVFTIGLYCFF